MFQSLWVQCCTLHNICHAHGEAFDDTSHGEAFDDTSAPVLCDNTDSSVDGELYTSGIVMIFVFPHTFGNSILYGTPNSPANSP